MVIIPLKSYFLSLLLLSLFTCLVPSSAASWDTYTTLDPYDRVVLLRIQNHFGGPKSGFWNSSDANCCVYCHDNVPITCDTDGHVRRLYLASGPNLSGTIPSAISDLPELSDLTITGTGFIGRMPAAFGKMNRLGYLVINNTRITATIPRSLGRLNNLSVLQLSYSRFYGLIPDFIANLTHVYELDLSHNKFSGPVPDFLIKMTSLIWLRLGSNRLYGPIPEFLGQKTGLEWIDLSSNKLFGTIPESLGNLSTLAQLILHSNKLSGPIPKFVSHMVFGRYISLHSNELTGEIPEGSWTKLDQFHLYLQNNQLTGKVPISLARAWFYNLDLSGNKLTDASRLFNRDTQGIWENLDLSNNLLKFDFSHTSFPREQCTLNISHNMIHGWLPRQLAQIPQGSSVDVSYNELCGPIPISSVLGQLSATNFEHNKCLCGAPLPPCNYTLPPCSAPSPSPF